MTVVQNDRWLTKNQRPLGAEVDVKEEDRALVGDGE